MTRPTILWLRRDLRTHDHPPLLAAAEQAGAGGVLPLFVIEPGLWNGSGDARRRWLAATLRATAEAYDGRLVLRVGDPVEVVPAVAKEIGAQAVHLSRKTTPHGRRRDAAVAQALGDVPMVATGSPYAIAPGLIRNGSDRPYQVFTPFSRAWHAHG